MQIYEFFSKYYECFSQNYECFVKRRIVITKYRMLSQTMGLSQSFCAWNILTLDVLTFIPIDNCDINPFIWENHSPQKFHNIDGYDII